MSESKTSPTRKFAPEGGWGLWVAEIFVGVLVLSLWSPLAGLLGITQPWVTILFIVGWVVFWMSPYGPRARRVLERIIRREG